MEQQTVMPCGDRILVEVIPMDEISDGGIYLPTNSEQTNLYGYVQAISDSVSEEAKDIASKLSIGSKVIYSKGMGAKIKLNCKDYVVIQLRDIIGIVK